MPKIYENDYERKISAFRKWHRGKRAMEGIRQEDLARERGVTTASISAKLRVKGSNQTTITYEDLLCFFKAVNATPEEIVHYMTL